MILVFLMTLYEALWSLSINDEIFLFVKLLINKLKSALLAWHKDIYNTKATTTTTKMYFKRRKATFQNIDMHI